MEEKFILFTPRYIAPAGAVTGLGHHYCYKGLILTLPQSLTALRCDYEMASK